MIYFMIKLLYKGGVCSLHPCYTTRGECCIYHTSKKSGVKPDQVERIQGGVKTNESV